MNIRKQVIILFMSSWLISACDLVKDDSSKSDKSAAQTGSGATTAEKKPVSGLPEQTSEANKEAA